MLGMAGWTGRSEEALHEPAFAVPGSRPRLPRGRPGASGNRGPGTDKAATPRRERMSVDLVRIVDSIHRDKNIPKEVLFEGIESALATAAKKHFPEAEEIEVKIDRDTGKTSTIADGPKVDPPDFGRIAAQTAKQVIIQKVRE